MLRKGWSFRELVAANGRESCGEVDTKHVRVPHMEQEKSEALLERFQQRKHERNVMTRTARRIQCGASGTAPAPDAEPSAARSKARPGEEHHSHYPKCPKTSLALPKTPCSTTRTT